MNMIKKQASINPMRKQDSLRDAANLSPSHRKNKKKSLKVATPDKMLIFLQSSGAQVDQNDIIQEESFESSQMSSNNKFKEKRDEEEEDDDDVDIDLDEEEEQMLLKKRNDEILDQTIIQDRKRANNYGNKGPSVSEKYQELNIVQYQIENELEIEQQILSIMRNDLDQLLSYIKGSRYQWLSHNLVNLYDCLLHNKVPNTWLIQGFTPIRLHINLKEWIETLIVKLCYLDKMCLNIHNEQSECIDFSKLFKPSLLVDQMLLRYIYQMNCLSLANYFDMKNVQFKAEILRHKISPLEIQKSMIKLRLDQTTIVHKVYVTGVKLIHARLDLRSGLLESSQPRVFENYLPSMCISINEKEDQLLQKNKTRVKQESSVLDSIDIEVITEQLLILPTQKGYYIFEKDEDLQQFQQQQQDSEKQKDQLLQIDPLPSVIPGLITIPTLRQRSSSEYQGRLKSQDTGRMKRIVMSPDNKKRMNKQKSGHGLQSMIKKQQTRNNSYHWQQPLQITQQEEKTLIESVQQRQHLYGSSTTKQAFTKQLKSNSNNLIPFLRHDVKLYTVRIPWILNQITPHSQKYHLIFQSHFNQAYWDGVGAYAICDPRNLLSQIQST